MCVCVHIHVCVVCVCCVCVCVCVSVCVCVCVFVCDKVLEVDKKKLGRGQGSGGDDMHVSSSSNDMHVSSSSYIHTGRGQGIGGGRHADRRRSGCSLDSQVRDYCAINEDFLCYICTSLCTPYTHPPTHPHKRLREGKRKGLVEYEKKKFKKGGKYLLPREKRASQSRAQKFRRISPFFSHTRGLSCVLDHVIMSY